MDPRKGRIIVTVPGICTGRAGGLSGMRAENLKVGLREATREKDPETRQWEKLASVTKLAF